MSTKISLNMAFASPSLSFLAKEIIIFLQFGNNRFLLCRLLNREIISPGGGAKYANIIEKSKRRNYTVSQCGLYSLILLYSEIHFGQMQFRTKQHSAQSEKAITKPGRNRNGGKLFVSACHHRRLCVYGLAVYGAGGKNLFRL